MDLPGLPGKCGSNGYQPWSQHDSSVSSHPERYDISIGKGKLRRSRSSDASINISSWTPESPLPKRNGVVQFVLRLLECWGLKERDAVCLLGYDPTTQSEHVDSILDGHEEMLEKEARERVSHLFWIFASIRSLFRDVKVENAWLREPHSKLDNQSPMSMLLNGSMKDLLLVREYVDWVAGR